MFIRDYQHKCLLETTSTNVYKGLPVQIFIRDYRYKCVLERVPGWLNELGSWIT